MGNIKKSCAILRSDFYGWVNNTKVYLFLFMTAWFAYVNFEVMSSYAERVGYRMNYCLFPFLFTVPYIRIILYTLFAFVMLDAPFMNSIQASVILRSRRRIWYNSQVIYIVLCSFFMTLYTAVIPILLNIRYIVFQGNWGKVLTNICNERDVPNPINPVLISKYEPWQALFFTGLVLFLLLILVGQVNFFFNITVKDLHIGSILVFGFIMLDFLFYLTDYYDLEWFSPFTWLQLDKLAYGYETTLPSIQYAVGVLAGMNILFVILINIKLKKVDVQIYVQD